MDIVTLYPFLWLILCILIASLIVSIIIISQNFNHVLETPPSPLESIDMDQMVGQWYVISNLPSDVDFGAMNYTISISKFDSSTYQLFLKYEVGSKLKPMAAENRLRTASFMMKGSKKSKVRGNAIVEPAVFNVTFFKSKELAFIERDEFYEWAVLAAPSGKYLWILSKTPVLPQGIYGYVCKTLARQGTFHMHSLQSISHL